MHRTQASSATADGGPPSDRTTPERVLDTAASLFWEKGYRATTTRQIAAAVGIQQASLYYHVRRKEELLYQVFVSSLEQLLTDVQMALEGERDPLDRIRVLIHAHLSTLLKHQMRHVMMLTDLRALSRAHRAAVLVLRKEYAALVRSALEAGQADGKIRTDIPSKYLYLALLNLLNWAVIWFRKDQALSADQLASLFASIFLNGAAPELPRVLPALAHAGKANGKALPKKPMTEKLARRRTSQRLLAAAAALFSKKGYGATSTREIAAVLGIQKASLYYHIGSKEDLLYAICKSSLEQIRQDVEAALAEVRDPVERILALVRAHLASMLRDQQEHAVAVSEMHLLSPERFEQVRSLRDAYDSLVRAVLQEAQNTGALRQDIPAKYLCLSLLGMMNRVEVWYRRSGPLSPDQLGQLMGAIFLTGAEEQP